MLVRRNGPLRRLLAALAVSQVGDWLYNLAVGGAGLRPDPFGELALVAAAGLPLLFAPVLAAVSTAYPPAVAATLPRLVDDGDLPAATAARSVIQSVSIIAGPAGGALLLLLGSPATAFLLNAATFAASAVILLGLPAGGLFAVADRDANASGVLRELRAGAAALRGNAVAARLVGADIICIGGIVVGALIAAPLVALVGLAGIGGLAAVYCLVLCLPVPARPVVVDPIPVRRG